MEEIHISSLRCGCTQNGQTARLFMTFNTNTIYKTLKVDSITSYSGFALVVKAGSETIFSTSSASPFSIDIQKYGSISIELNANETSSGNTTITGLHITK